MPVTTRTDKIPCLLTSTTLSYNYLTGFATDVTTGSYELPQTVKYLYKSWVNTPNFRALKASGGVLPQNSFNYTYWERDITRGTITGGTSRSGPNWQYTIEQYTGSRWVGIDVLAPSSDWSGIAAALIKKAKGAEWNVPIFFAEGRKTVSMVVETAERLVLMGLALKRGRFTDFARLAHPSAKTRLANNKLRKKFGVAYSQDPKKAFSSYWLQLQYGWVPFMSDVRSAVETLCDMAERPDSLDGKVRASTSSVVTTEKISEGLIFSMSTGWNVYGTYEYIRSRKVRGVWSFTINPLDIPGRLGLLNPASVVWELVPFSFVADWFLPIGDYLSALDAPLRFSHRNGVYGERLQSQMTTSATRVTGATAFSGFSGTGVWVNVRRVPMTAIPSVSLLKLSFDAKLGATRVTSSIALLHQVFKK